MAGAIKHRGPDDLGEWADRDAGIALAHRRLAILDPSPSGAQPMASPSGRYVIVFNGEIYNHLDLRSRLGRDNWRGLSDTETLLACVERWGVEETLTQLCGMYAIALWDRKERALTLVRDRLGEKPLYYGWQGGAFLFGSELKAFMSYPDFAATIDREAAAAYLRYSYVPDPATIFKNIYKLRPGHSLRLDTAWSTVLPKPYWTLEAAVHSGISNPLCEDYATLCDRVEGCLREVILSQMMSDVPLGCFLSGGIDSSLIAAIMQSSSAGRVRSFSIGFEDARFNEAHHARQVAAHLGTKHTEFIVTETDALAVIQELPQIYDEPFADASQIPTILLSRLTRQQVTVALSGDGGDEIFGGYNRYSFAPALWKYTAAVPGAGRKAAAAAAIALQLRGFGEKPALRSAASLLGLPITTVDKLSKIGGALGRARTFEDFYWEVVSTFFDPCTVLLEPPDATTKQELRPGAAIALDKIEWMMAMDAVSYLPGDILVKVDRAAMSASLETRAPFLDRRVVELAWRLPLSAKIKRRTGKRILRDILYRYVPRQLLERPKQGFAIPLDRWLRGPLREWAEDLLSPARLATTGLFDARNVRLLWERHQTMKDNAGGRLWAILMMQSWLLCYGSFDLQREHRAECLLEP
jgi:asparagine synthase (glutamine-hydrolysing)